ncbi:MAG: hypothetical protein HYV07_30380 [Deltaproteobacteria bacterium]|nr:hypothetical protein [Deltaproteobacteria bacterium]
MLIEVLGVKADLSPAAAIRSELASRLTYWSALQIAQGDFGSEVKKCGVDEACIGTILRNHGIELGVLVVANGTMSPGLISAALIGAGGSSEQEFWTAPVSSPAVVSEIADRVEKLLLGAGRVKGGRILVKLTPASAELSLVSSTNREAEALDRGTYVVPEGIYRAVARGEGLVPQSRELRAVVGQDTEVTIVLNAVEPVPIWHEWWLWTGLGVLAAGAATAIVLSQPTIECLCLSFEGTSCDC